MEKLAKRIRSSNKQYFDAGVDAGTQKACDLLLVAAYECGFIRTPEHTERMTDLWNRRLGVKRTIRRCRCGKRRN